MLKTCYNSIIENNQIEGIETMNNELQNLLNSFGSTERFLIGPKPYDPKTVAEMADDIASDIEDAITALQNDEESKMVRKVRNGYRVKIGYGAKNESVITFGTKTLRNGKTVPLNFRFFESKKEDRGIVREEAIQFLTTVKGAIEAGQLNDVLEAKLDSYRDRAELGKAKRSEYTKVRQFATKVAQAA
jgi:hypothetical protein